MAYAGGTPQFTRPADNGEIDLVRVSDDAVVARTPTDAGGKFTFSNVPTGVYHVGLEGFKSMTDTVEVTRPGQRDCRQPLFVLLYLREMEETNLESRIVLKLPPHYGNAFTEPHSKERDAAFVETNAGSGAGLSLDAREQHFRNAIRIDPSYWWPHTNLGQVFVERQQFAEAEAELREGARLAGNAELPYWLLTTFLVDRGRDDDAEQAANQAKRDGVDSAGLSASLGLLAFRKHQWKEAERQLRAAFEFTPEPLLDQTHWDEWDAWLVLALRHEGKSREADERTRALLDESGDEPTVLNMIGYDMVERNDRLDEAVLMLEKAHAADPDEPEILDSLGWANFKLRRLEVAEPQLKKAAADLPNDPDVLEHLGEVYAARGKADAARAAFQSALGHATDAEQRRRVARRLKELR